MDETRRASPSAVLSINISREGPGRFSVSKWTNDENVPVTEHYRRLQDAIRAEAIAIAVAGIADFVEFRFEGMSTGTLMSETVVGHAAELADRLTALVSEDQRLQADRRPPPAPEPMAAAQAHRNLVATCPERAMASQPPAPFCTPMR